MRHPSSAERKRQLLTQRLRRVAADVPEIAFDAAREIHRDGYRDVPHEDDPYDYVAGCEQVLLDAAENAAAAAGFDVNDPQVGDEILAKPQSSPAVP